MYLLLSRITLETVRKKSLIYLDAKQVEQRLTKLRKAINLGITYYKLKVVFRLQNYCTF
jgi:hypothetical protein